jgi:hypothetical protein
MDIPPMAWVGRERTGSFEGTDGEKKAVVAPSLDGSIEAVNVWQIR